MNTRSIDLFPELWFQILELLSKQDIYTCSFVSKAIREIATLPELYDKAPAPWPNRNYRLFKDAQQANAEPPNSDGKAFEKHDVLFDGIHHPRIDQSKIEIMHSLYTAYCKHKYKNLSDEAIKHLIPTFPHDYPNLHTGASPQYGIAIMRSKSYILNMETLKACYLGSSVQTLKAGLLSNNDIYVLNQNEDIHCFAIRYGWDAKKNEFEHIKVFPIDDRNKCAHFHADQLVVHQEIISAESALKIGLFNFKTDTLRYLNVKQDPTGSFQGAGYFVFPLDENHLIGFGNKYAHHSPAQPLWIWDNKTGELVFSDPMSSCDSYEVRQLANGNLYISEEHDRIRKRTLRFGFFNQFDQPANSIENKPNFKPSHTGQ